MSKEEEGYIAFFDSGVGGLTVLHEAMKHLSNENLLYYADSANVPYGNKSSEEIKSLVDRAIKQIMEYNVKAIVLACNTATSISVKTLRQQYDIPIIGMEPAIKLAAENQRDQKILVLATQVTLQQEKYQDLMTRLGIDGRVTNLPMPELVDMSEEFILEGKRVDLLLRHKFNDIAWADYSAVVLGCTHFVYYKSSIQKLVPPHVQLYDGNTGTVKRLISQIKLSDARHTGRYKVLLSGHIVDPEVIQPYLSFLKGESIFNNS